MYMRGVGECSPPSFHSLEGGGAFRKPNYFPHKRVFPQGQKQTILKFIRGRCRERAYSPPDRECFHKVKKIYICILDSDLVFLYSNNYSRLKLRVGIVWRRRRVGILRLKSYFWYKKAYRIYECVFWNHKVYFLVNKIY